MHLEVLVEEPSAEVALTNILPKVLPVSGSFAVHPYNGKHDLLRKLPSRLRGYKRFMGQDWSIVVLVDRDNDDCLDLKGRMEGIARGAGLLPPGGEPGGRPPRVINRIAVEELEAWFFGDPGALVAAFPRIPPSVCRRERFRDPDAIQGTWEALEQVLRRAGYCHTGMPKIETARRISEHMDPARNSSRSFQVFVGGLARLASTG